MTKQSLLGEKYGRLTPISPVFKTKEGVALNMRCDCGTEKIVRVDRILSGRTKSCGCLVREVSRLLRPFDEEGNPKHSAIVEHKAYNSARARCSNPKAPGYKDCGGAGIQFHPAWIDNFPKFFEDMGPAKAGQILTRRNLRADFTPENCFWGSWRDIGVSMNGLRRETKLSVLPVAA